MGRPPSGQEVLERAKECLTQARTVEEFRQAQAVLLPLSYGLTLPQVAEAIGVSISWACQLRTRFIREGKLNAPSRSATCKRPRRQKLSWDEETEFLVPYLEPARTGGVVAVRAIKPALEARLGRSVALASVYNLLHRHGWHKPAPGTRHPSADGVEGGRKDQPTTST